jgi:hypothetical protein
VITLANPVRSPSPIPAADSTKTVFELAEAYPPAAPASPSTNSAAHVRQHAVLVEQARLLAEPGHRAHRVEEVGQHQREHQQRDGDQRQPGPRAERDVADQREIRHAENLLGQRGVAQVPALGVHALRRPDLDDRLDDDRQHGRGEHADQDRAAHPPGHQNAGEQQAHDEYHGRPGSDRAVDA